MMRTHALKRTFGNWSICSVLLTSVFSVPFASAADSAATQATAQPLALIAFDTLLQQKSDVSEEALRKNFLQLAAQEASGDYREARMLPGFPKPMVTQGVFHLRGTALTWEAKSPFPSVLHVSPTGIVIEADGERQELSAAEIPAAGRAAEVLSSLLSGNLTDLETLFDVRATCVDRRILLAARPKELAQQAPNTSTQLARVVKELRASALLGENAHVDTLELEAADGTLTRIELENVRVTR